MRQGRSCQTHSEAPSRIKRILKLPKRSPLDQRASLARRDPPPQANIRKHQPQGLDEPDRPDGPGEPRRGQQLPRHGREDQPSRRAPARRHADGEAPLLAKVRRHRRHRGAEEAPVADAHADALGQEELPVLGAHGRGEDAQELEGCSEEEDLAKVLRNNSG